MYPVLFKIGPISVYAYGTAVALGFIISIFFAGRSAKKEGIKPEIISDLGLYALVSGLIGARFVYILTDLKTFVYHPVDIFKIWEGGFVFYGGLLFGIITGIWYLKRAKLDVFKAADIIAPYIALAHSIGRIGCFLRGCCYGRASYKFGIIFPSLMDGTPHLPVQLIESFFLFLIFLILLFRKKYKKFNGEIFWLYIFLYSTARFILEIFRADYRGPEFFGLLSISQVVSILFAVLAFISIKKNLKSGNPL